MDDMDGEDDGIRGSGVGERIGEVVGGRRTEEVGGKEDGGGGWEG